MPNTAMFTSKNGEIKEMERYDLEEWYLDKNPRRNLGDFDCLKDELARTNFADLSEEYYKDGDFASYKIVYDPKDPDISDRLMHEVKYLMADLRQILPEKKLKEFLNSI